MRVYINGLIIPNTNMWEIDESWTACKLVDDVISLVSSKQQAGEGYSLYFGETKIDDNLTLVEHYSAETEFTIRAD